MMSTQKNNGPIVDPALCRCCRAIKKCRILTAEYTWMGKKEIYADMVMDCYGILLSHVDGNERDSGVCATCVVRLREASAFRRQVLQCEELFLQAKLENHEEEEKDEAKLKKFDLELKTEPKDYSSDHHSLDDRDEPCAAYSDDDAEDNKPLKSEDPKPEPRPEELKSEDSMDYGDSSSDSDEPIKKKAKRKAKEAKTKTNGAKKKLGKVAKKQKAETGQDTNGSGTQLVEIEVPEYESVVTGQIGDPEIHLAIKVEPCSDTSVTITETMETGAETGVPVKKRIWVRPLPSGKTEYQKLCEEMLGNEDLYFRHYNMSKESFEELYVLLEASIRKGYTNYRHTIEPRLRLSVCLRYLQTGDSRKSISDFYGIGHTTAASIVTDVSKAIWNVLQPIYMPTPTIETWERCEEAFREVWKVPNCIGSIAGRHIIARTNINNQSPLYSPTYFRMYSSAVFLAIADPFHNLVMIDIGNYGKVEDRRLLELTSFYKDFLSDTPLLPAKPLPGFQKKVPHVFLADEGLLLSTYMLREYPRSTADKHPYQKVFNDRIRAGRTVDTVFEQLTSHWRFLRQPVECNVENSVHLARAACCLHNYVKQKHGDYLGGTNEVVRKKRRKKLRNGLVPFKKTNSRASVLAMKMREDFAAYFNQDAQIVEHVPSVEVTVKVEPS